MSHAYDELPPAPEALLPTTVLARMVDGLAFRYRWAGEGLTAEQLAYRPGEGAMSTEELLDHLRFLARWLRVNVAAAASGGAPVPYPAACDGLADPTGDPQAYRRQTLDALWDLRGDLLAMDAATLDRVVLVGGREGATFPVWHLMNGPLADALTHVGQLNSWRRLMGSPAPRADVFRGRPPREARGA